MNIQNFKKYDPEGVSDSDVFFCVSSYTAKSKSINKLNNLPAQVSKPKMIPRDVARTLNRLGTIELRASGITKIGKVPILFVPDAEVPRHVQPAKSNTGVGGGSRGKKSGTRDKASNVLRTPLLAVEADKALAAQNAADTSTPVLDETAAAARASLAETALDEAEDEDAHEDGAVAGRELYTFSSRAKGLGSSTQPGKRRRTDAGAAAAGHDRDDANNDECKVCEYGGNLVCCDGCPLAYHPRCIGLKLSDFDNDDDWHCPECDSTRKKKGKGKAKASPSPKAPRGRLTRASLAAIKSDGNDGGNSSEEEDGSDDGSGNSDLDDDGGVDDGEGGVSGSDDGDGDGEDDGEFDEDEDEDAALERQRENVDDYFHSKRSSSKTSDRTLAQLGGGRMDQYELGKALAKRKNPFKKEQSALLARLEEKEEEWAAQLEHGFNMLCYGFGSKKTMLMGFAGRRLKDVPQIVVNGYFPSLHIKQILTCITESLLGFAGPYRNVPEHVAFIKAQYESGEGAAGRGLYLLVNNIDGPMLRNEAAQMSLSQLAETENIHIVASIDQLNAPLMWDHDKLARFNWLWHDCTTFRSYAVETSYEASLMSASGTVTVRGTMVVMQSLTRNGRKVFWILLEHQKKFSTAADYKGLRFADYLGMCQQQFAAHDDSRLRAYMTELEDHKLLACRKVEGVEFLSIPVNGSMLSSVTDMMAEHFGEDKPRA